MGKIQEAKKAAESKTGVVKISLKGIDADLKLPVYTAVPATVTSVATVRVIPSTVSLSGASNSSASVLTAASSSSFTTTVASSFSNTSTVAILRATEDIVLKSEDAQSSTAVRQPQMVATSSFGTIPAALTSASASSSNSSADSSSTLSVLATAQIGTVSTLTSASSANSSGISLNAVSVKE